MADHRSLLIVGPVPPPTGGIATHCAALELALRASGVDATVIDPGRGRVRLSAALARAALHGTRVHVHVCGHNVMSYALIGMCLASNPTLGPIVTLHSGLAPAYLEKLPAAGRVAVGGLLRAAAEVVCVSPRIAEAARALGATHVTAATPFIAAGLTVASPPRRCLEARVRHARLACATVAPGREYGADVLAAGFAAAASEDPSLGLVVFGPGGADAVVARAVTAMGFPGRVTPLGELGHDAALGVIAAADVFVRPTRADGDAISVREALYLDRAVVASDAAPRPPGTMIFAGGDGHALAEALSEAFTRPLPAAPPPDGWRTLAPIYRGLGLELIGPLAQESSPERMEAACAASPAV